MTTITPTVPVLRTDDDTVSLRERDEKLGQDQHVESAVGQHSAPVWTEWRNNTAKSWWNDASLRRCMFEVVICFGSIFANGYDSGVMSSLQANEGWLVHFNNPTGSKLGAIVSAYSFPNLVFPLLGSYLADKVGRKPIILVASICGIAGPLLGGLGSSLGTFVAGRVITGIACAFFQVTAPNLIAEIAHPRFRAVVSATYLTTYYVGAAICGWLGYGMVVWGSDKGWRVMTILQCLGCVPLAIWSALPWMAESPRYLVKKGKKEQALQTLARLHSNGDTEDELVQNEFREIVLGVELDAQNTSSYMDFFKTPGNKKRLWLVVWFSWAQSMSGNNLFAYYLPQIFMIAGISSFLQIQGLSGGLTLFLLFVGVGTAQLVERVGRRKILLTSLIALIIGFVILTALSGSFAQTGNSATGIAIIPLIFIALAFYVAAMVPLPYLYIPEILPYGLRSKGLAIFSVLTAAGQVYNAYVNAIALAAIAWKYYIVFIVTDVIQVVIAYFIIIETKGLTLEDIAILFDGDQTNLAVGRHIEDK